MLSVMGVPGLLLLAIMAGVIFLMYRIYKE